MNPSAGRGPRHSRDEAKSWCRRTRAVATEIAGAPRARIGDLRAESRHLTLFRNNRAHSLLSGFIYIHYIRVKAVRPQRCVGGPYKYIGHLRGRVLSEMIHYTLKSPYPNRAFVVLNRKTFRKLVIRFPSMRWRKPKYETPRFYALVRMICLAGGYQH